MFYPWRKIHPVASPSTATHKFVNFVNFVNNKKEPCDGGSCLKNHLGDTKNDTRGRRHCQGERTFVVRLTGG